MRQILLGLVAGLVLVPTCGLAQDTLTRACDLAAASPNDRTRPANIAGVALNKIDPKVALPACQAALTAAPENSRLLYQMGRILEASKDDTKARSFYEKAAAWGHAGAQANFGLLYETGRGGLPKNDQQAARLYKLAADQGNVYAQYRLGVFYQEGRGALTKSDEEAARLFKLAADQGNASAQAWLGYFYKNGLGGLPKSDQEAAHFFKLASDQGDAYAQYELGVFYENGTRRASEERPGSRAPL